MYCILHMAIVIETTIYDTAFYIFLQDLLDQEPDPREQDLSAHRLCKVRFTATVLRHLQISLQRPQLDVLVREKDPPLPLVGRRAEADLEGRGYLAELEADGAPRRTERRNGEALFEQTSLYSHFPIRFVLIFLFLSVFFIFIIIAFILTRDHLFFTFGVFFSALFGGHDIGQG